MESVFGLDFEDDLKYTEVQEGLKISKWFEKVSDDLKYNRDWINNIKNNPEWDGFDDISAAEYVGLSQAEIKKKDIDFLMQINNDIANMVLQDIRKANFETIERDIFGFTKYEEEEKPVKKKRHSILDSNF